MVVTVKTELSGGQSFAARIAVDDWSEIQVLARREGVRQREPVDWGFRGWR